jgi:hypothetical protein
MEILIPGLLLVALMVYVSTRIKRSAADAYEAERVETDDFAIAKPEGFIIIESGDPKVLFAAYSKEYGLEDADRFRQVSTELRLHKGKEVARVRDGIAQGASRITSEQHLAGPSAIIEAETEQHGIRFDSEHRLTEKDGDTFELCVTALSETKEANQKYIDSMFSSFEVR